MKKFVAFIVATTAIVMFASTAYASDGDLDTTWGGDGVVVSAHNDPSAAYAIANYPNDRVLAVGSITEGLSSRILVNRFLNDGTFDTTCNSTGEFIDATNNPVASDVVVLTDGSFVVAGTMQINNLSSLFLAKFDSSCNFDISFGDFGVATFSESSGTSGQALAIQDDGKIVVVGNEYPAISDSSDQRILVTRFSSTGVLDTSFATGGRFISSSNEKGSAADVIIDSSGHIVFAGSIVGTIAADAAIVGRLTSSGQLDNSFADLGYFVNELSGDPQLKSVALRPNGHLVAVGSFIEPTPGATKSILALCLDNTGILDAECGSTGWGYLGASTIDAVANSVTVTTDGFIIIGGTVFPISTEPSHPFVMRLGPDLMPDITFATSGIWNGSAISGQIHSVAVQNDGKIIGAGESDAQGIFNLTVFRLGNTVVTTSSTTTTTLTTTTTTASSTTSPATSTTIAPNQLPATGGNGQGGLVALFIVGLGVLLLATRRRVLH